MLRTCRRKPRRKGVSIAASMQPNRRPAGGCPQVPASGRRMTYRECYVFVPSSVVRTSLLGIRVGQFHEMNLLCAAANECATKRKVRPRVRVVDHPEDLHIEFLRALSVLHDHSRVLNANELDVRRRRALGPTCTLPAALWRLVHTPDRLSASTAARIFQSINDAILTLRCSRTLPARPTKPTTGLIAQYAQRSGSQQHTDLVQSRPRPSEVPSRNNRLVELLYKLDKVFKMTSIAPKIFPRALIF